uniref:NAC domain-containing protein n=1 Tax=Oryza barthii TaxID=65489 RepID=A0A0D3ENZ1_9ORYZ
MAISAAAADHSRASPSSAATQPTTICWRPSKVKEEVEEDGMVVDPPDDASEASDNLRATGFQDTPTVGELVLRHLRPRLRGFHCADGDVPVIGVRDDPAAAAPLDLVARHGGAADRRRGEAFYFVRRRRCRRPNVRRTVAEGGGGGGGAGGLWKKSWTGSGKSVTDLGVVVPWSKTCYCFYRRDEGGRLSTFGGGWVLAEYEITEPGTYRRADEEEDDDDYWVLCHVRKTASKKRKRNRCDEAVAARAVAGTESKSYPVCGLTAN